MKRDSTSGPNRRRFLKGAASLAGGAVLAGSSAFTTLAAFAQDPPNCPTPPSGGTPFAPGSDTRPIVLRKSIAFLSAAELTQLRSAYAALRALPASDKRTWIIQADMHALFCASCNNSPTDIHGSWSFFPWHRAYLYYYERILGSLAGDLAHFRLPYWDWENIRPLPPSYATPGDASNSLWDGNRRSALAGGGSLPVSDGTSARISTLYGLTDFDSFGGNSFSNGALEADPHGTIHVDVGQPPPLRHDMGSLGYAARDPLFFAHHCNIDKLWSGWNDLAGGGGLPPNAYRNPTNAGFLNLRWSFYDENQQVVSISAADVLDHQNNLRYIYKGPIFRIPPLLLILECELICCGPGPDPGPFLKVSEQVRETVIKELRANSPVVLVLQGVAIPPGLSGNFDVFALRGERRIQVGSLGIIDHGNIQHEKEHRPVTLVLDIAKASEELLAKEKPATLHVFRRLGEQEYGKGIGILRPGQKLEEPFQLKVERAQIRVARQQ